MVWPDAGAGVSMRHEAGKEAKLEKRYPDAEQFFYHIKAGIDSFLF